MKIRPNIKSIEDLYFKACREMRRSYDSKLLLEMSDHFYNFCITADSLRDYCLEKKGIYKGKEKTQQNDLWKSNVFINAVNEIASAVKHFQLRKFPEMDLREPSTEKVEIKEDYVVDFVMRNNELLLPRLREILTIYVDTSDGKSYNLFEFTQSVMKYWKDFLQDQGIEISDLNLLNEQ